MIVKDEGLPCNQWSLGRIEEVYPSSDEHIRKVKLVMGDIQIDNQGKRTKPLRFLERPIHKLVLILPSSRALKRLRYAHSGDWGNPRQTSLAINFRTLDLISVFKIDATSSVELLSYK